MAFSSTTMDWHLVLRLSAKKTTASFLFRRFLKNWAMTGWRMGWVQGSKQLAQVVENLVQYNTLGVAQFMQCVGIAALQDGESFAKS